MFLSNILMHRELALQRLRGNLYYFPIESGQELRKTKNQQFRKILGSDAPMKIERPDPSTGKVLLPWQSLCDRSTGIPFPSAG
jgi:hypothetical protein